MHGKGPKGATGRILRRLLSFMDQDRSGGILSSLYSQWRCQKKWGMGWVNAHFGVNQQVSQPIHLTFRNSELREQIHISWWLQQEGCNFPMLQPLKNLKVKFRSLSLGKPFRCMDAIGFVLVRIVSGPGLPDSSILPCFYLPETLVSPGPSSAGQHLPTLVSEHQHVNRQ